MSFCSSRLPLKERVRRLYGWTAERFSQHRYPAEAAAIWLEGIMETGAPELAEQLRQAVAPADMIESGLLKRFLKTAYGKPAEQITWEDLYHQVFEH